MANWLALFGVKSAFAAGCVAVVVAGSAIVFKDQLANLFEPASLTAPQKAALTKEGDASSQAGAGHETNSVPQPDAVTADNKVLITPTFDILRVEEDGSLLVAGNAAPMAKVDLTGSDGSVLASGEAGPEGDFVLLPAAPLKPGDYVLTLRSTGETGKPVQSLQSSVVTVPEPGGEVLAMISETGKASQIIAKPQALESKPETPSAPQATPATEVPETAVVGKPESAEAHQPVASAPAAPAEKRPEVKQSESTALATNDSEATPPESAAVSDTDVEEPVVPESPAAVAGEEKQPNGQKVEIARLEPATPAVEEPAEIVMPVVTEPATEEVETAPAVIVPEAVPKAENNNSVPPPRVIVEAVEIEGDQIYVAGAVPQGVSVRVYIDNEFIGLTQGTSDNRFLVSNVFNLTEGEHAVRADVVDSTDGSVLSRAEVPLVHEVPKEPVPQTEVAAASPEPAPAQLVAEPSVSEPQKQEINPISQKPVEVAAKPASEPVSTAQSEVQVANSEQKPEPTSPTVAETSATAAPEPVEEEPVGVAVEPAAKIDEPASVEPKLSVKQPENDTTVVVQPKADTPVAPTETADNAPPEQTQPVSVPAKRAPTVIRTGRAVIIKRGDNLWRISRKTYGLGIRYTTIYNANRNQIRNPHRIYVGQIFKIPEKAEQEG
jgi:nucleoid-associated protein YgaU